MTKTLALALTTKDRPHLSERAITRLWHDDIDLWVMDGSTTLIGLNWLDELAAADVGVRVRSNVVGGADAAIVYALTTLLNETESPYVGICENDVLLHSDWFAPTLALFERGESEGLQVGAASARCYDDRILAQRDGYALMHNLGAGHLILTRRAARLLLDFYRSPWSVDNRRVFCQLGGTDIGKYWAFRGERQFLTVDWGFDVVLARHGLASLALCPSPCEMIGQDVPLDRQGLKLVTEPVEMLRNDKAFDRFADATARIRGSELCLNGSSKIAFADDSWVIFAHQMSLLGGSYDDTWRFRWSQGFGPFAYEAAHAAGDIARSDLHVPVSGPCAFMVSGGKDGGKVEVTDTHSGYQVLPDLPPEGEAKRVMQLMVPAAVTYRTIRLRMLTPGTRFYGIRVQEPQPVDPLWTFDHSALPMP